MIDKTEKRKKRNTQERKMPKIKDRVMKMLSETILDNLVLNNVDVKLLVIGDNLGNLVHSKLQKEFSNENLALMVNFVLAFQEISQIIASILNVGKIVKECEIIGNEKAVWLKNLSPKYFIQAVTSSRQEISELRDLFIETILKDVFSRSVKTIGLVSSDGFPIWFEGKHNLLQVANVASNVLSMAERLNIELKLGNIDSVEISANDNEMTVEIVFNEAQDLLLTLIGVSCQEADMKVARELFRGTTRQEFTTLLVPSNWVEEREEIIKQILEETQDVTYSGDEREELLALRSFNEETINQLEILLKELYRRYRCREVSIPYLRKRMRLPPAVINLTLQSLMLEGRLGNSQIILDPESKVPFLRLDLSVMGRREDPKLIQEIKYHKQQILDQVIERHLAKFEHLWRESVKKKERKTFHPETRFSEIQALMELVDTSEIKFLASTLRKEWKKWLELTKTLSLLIRQVEKRSISLDSTDDVIFSELERRQQVLRKRIRDQLILIKSYQVNFERTLRQILALMERIFPPVTARFYLVKKKKRKSTTLTLKYEVFLRCESWKNAVNCPNSIKIKNDSTSWLKLFFIQQLACLLAGKEPYSLKEDSSIKIKKYGSAELKKIQEDHELVREYFDHFLRDEADDSILDETALAAYESFETLFLSKHEMQKLYHFLQELGYYDKFGRCTHCHGWYCLDGHHYDIEKRRCQFCDSDSK